MSDGFERSERWADAGGNAGNTERAERADDELQASRLDADPSRGIGGDQEEGAAPSVSASTSPLPRRLTTRRRVVAALTAGGAVALALVVVLASVPSGGATLGTVLGRALGVASPTPTATLAVGDTTVGLVDSVPWGALTVDGRTVDLRRLAETLKGDGAILPPLPRGTHRLAYTAAPFPPLRCQFSVPAARGDTCPLGSIPSPYTVATTPLRAVDLRATPEHLPAAAYDALLEAVRALVAQQAIPDGQVEPGDHYRSHSGAVVVASEPLSVQIQVALSAPAPGFVFGATCNPLCVEPVGTVENAAWELVAPIVAVARVMDAHGAGVDMVPVDGSGLTAFASVPSPYLLIAAQWTGAWTVRLGGFAASSVASVVGGYLCAIGGMRVQQLVLLHIPYPAFSATYGPATEPAAGCLFRGTYGSVASTTQSTFLVYARYGALMAVDEATQRAQPQLARPSPHERALIAQITL